MERRPTILGQHHSVSSLRRTQTKSLPGSPIRRRRVNTRSTGAHSLATACHSPRLCSSPLTTASNQPPLYDPEDRFASHGDRRGELNESISYNMRDSYENEFHRKISNMIALHGIRV